MSRFRTAAGRLLATLVLATLVACGGGGDAPADGAAEGGAAVAAGQQAFETYCVACHGPQASGTEAGPPLVHLVYEPSHHPDDAFRSAARNGVQPHHWEFGPMPPVPAITDDEIDAVIAYVRDLQQKAGIE